MVEFELARGEIEPDLESTVIAYRQVPAGIVAKDHIDRLEGQPRVDVAHAGGLPGIRHRPVADGCASEPQDKRAEVGLHSHALCWATGNQMHQQIDRRWRRHKTPRT